MKRWRTARCRLPRMVVWGCQIKVRVTVRVRVRVRVRVSVRV